MRANMIFIKNNVPLLLPPWPQLIPPYPKRVKPGQFTPFVTTLCSSVQGASGWAAELNGETEHTLASVIAALQLVQSHRSFERQTI